MGGGHQPQDRTTDRDRLEDFGGKHATHDGCDGRQLQAAAGDERAGCEHGQELGDGAGRDWVDRRRANSLCKCVVKCGTGYMKRSAHCSCRLQVSNSEEISRTGEVPDGRWARPAWSARVTPCAHQRAPAGERMCGEVAGPRTLRGRTRVEGSPGSPSSGGERGHLGTRRNGK